MNSVAKCQTELMCATYVLEKEPAFPPAATGTRMFGFRSNFKRRVNNNPNILSSGEIKLHEKQRTICKEVATKRSESSQVTAE